MNFCDISSGYIEVHLSEIRIEIFQIFFLILVTFSVAISEYIWVKYIDRNILEFFLIFVTFPVAISEYIWVKHTQRNILDFFKNCDIFSGYF